MNHTIKPMPLRLSLLLFGIPSAVFTFAIYVWIPRMMRVGVPLLAIFTIVLALPLAIMLGAALMAYRLEGRPWRWKSFRERFRLGRMDASGWLWSAALAAFMFGGISALVFTFVAVLIAYLLERRRVDKYTWLWTAGLALCLTGTWALGFTAGWLSHWEFFTQPRFLQDFLSHLGPKDFMGIPLRGNWWIALYYMGVLMFLNIFGEELWWRGYILPRQELRHGKWTWIVHGFLWTAFHIFWIWNLWNLVARLPSAFALAFVCQRLKNTWPGIIGHAVGNSPILIEILVYYRKAYAVWLFARSWL